MKKALKIIGIILLVLVLLFAAYVAYVLIRYHRIGSQPIAPEGTANGTIETGTEYKIVSYNIGFGAYESDFGFFMDGGDRAWAWSKERLDKNLKEIGTVLQAQDADILLIQEIDIRRMRISS